MVKFPPEDGRPDQLLKLRPGTGMRRTLQMNKIVKWDSPCNEDLQCLCNCGMLVRRGMHLFEEPSTQERLMLENHNVSPSGPHGLSSLLVCFGLGVTVPPPPPPPFPTRASGAVLASDVPSSCEGVGEGRGDGDPNQA